MTATDETAPSAGKAMVWAGVTMAGTRVVTLVATLILARLLVPADFGVFAVGLLIINYLDRVKDMGVGSGLVYRREPWEQVAPTGLPLVTASSLVLATLAFLSAPMAANFFEDQRIVAVLRGLSVVLFISGVAGVPEAKMRRGMDFRRRLVPELAAAVVKNGLSVGLAVSGVGVMSLVYGQLVGTLVQAVLYWSLCGWRPAFGWDRQMARELLRFGMPASLVALLSVFIENIDYLVVGHRLGAEQLGFYTMAYRVPEISILAVCIMASQVFFPAFSRLQDDLPRLREAYFDAARVVAAFTLPVGASMFVLAPEIVISLFSSRWEPSIPVLRLIALFAAIQSMSFHAGELYKATGRPGILNILAIGDILILFPLLWLAAGHSIVAVAATMCGGIVALSIARLLIVVRILHLDARALARAFVPGILIALAIGVIDEVATRGLHAVAPGMSSLVELVVLGALTVVAYIALLRYAAPDVMRLGLATIRPGGARS